MDSATGSVRHQSRSAGSYGTEDVIQATLPAVSTAYRARWVKKATGRDMYLLDDTGAVLNQIVGNTDAPVNFSTYSLGVTARSRSMAFDWVIARPYVAIEPTAAIQ